MTLDDGNGHAANFNALLNSSEGTWSAPVAIAGLPDGNFTVSVAATDLAGNDTAIASAGTVTIDAAPSVTIDNQVSNHSAVTLTGTLDPAIVSIGVTVGGTTFTSGAGDVVISGTNWSLALPTMADGNYAVSASATDALGNIVGADGSLLIDTVAPTVGITSGQLPKRSPTPTLPIAFGDIQPIRISLPWW